MDLEENKLKLKDIGYVVPCGVTYLLCLFLLIQFKASDTQIGTITAIWAIALVYLTYKVTKGE